MNLGYLNSKNTRKIKNLDLDNRVRHQDLKGYRHQQILFNIMGANYQDKTLKENEFHILSNDKMQLYYTYRRFKIYLMEGVYNSNTNQIISILKQELQRKPIMNSFILENTDIVGSSHLHHIKYLKIERMYNDDPIWTFNSIKGRAHMDQSSFPSGANTFTLRDNINNNYSITYDVRGFDKILDRWTPTNINNICIFPYLGAIEVQQRTIIYNMILYTKEA